MPLYFQNETELDLRGLLTFGVSAKETDSPIGYFGTGLKYALAVLMREGCKVQIYIGKSRVDVKLKSIVIRNRTFRLIYLNNKEAAYTTTLGQNWELWQAYRELVANCLDENYPIITDEYVAPKEGYTTIVVYSDKFEALYKDQAYDPVFLSTTPVFKLSGLEAHPAEGDARWLFYNGIRAFRLDKPAMYNYNLTEQIQLTEDRTIPSLSRFYEIFARSLAKCDHASLIRQVLEADQRYFESTIDHNWYSFSPGKVYNRIVAKYIMSGKKFNTSARAKYKRDNPDSELPTVVQWESLPIDCRNKFRKSISFWKELGYEIPPDVIKISDSLGHLKGKTVKGNVYLNQSILENNLRAVKGYIYKFWAQTKPKIESIEESDLLIDTIVDFGERLLVQPGGNDETIP